MPVHPLRQLAREVIADAAIAFVATLVIALVIASLAAAGIITMALAFVLLGLAWVVGVGGSFLLPWPISRRHSTTFAGFFGIMLIAVGWYESAHYEKPPSAFDIAREVMKAITAGQKNIAPTSSATLDRTVSLNCIGSTRPTHLREDRLLWVVQIQEPTDKSRPARFFVNPTFFMQGTTRIKWPDQMPPSASWTKCSLANYASIALFKVSVEMFVEWKEAIKNSSSSTSSGETFYSGFAPSPQFDLGIQPRNEDYFYILNMTENYITITIPQLATVRTSDSDVAKTIILIPPTTHINPFPLFPNTSLTIPQAAIPQVPVPMPPSRPKSK